MSKCKVCGSDCKNNFCSISCSNKYWNPITKNSRIKLIKKADEIITYNGECKKCGDNFSVTRERKKLVGKNIPKYCSRKCANSRTHSLDTIAKIKQSILLKYPIKVEKPKIKNTRNKIKFKLYCEECGKLVTGKNAKRFCSQTCSANNIHRINEELIISKLVSGSNIVGKNHRCIKSALITLKGHKCVICKNTEWMGEPIPLVMDHIDGRSNNNTLDNLRLVCGNCDMKLPTYKSKNKNSDRKHRSKYS